MTKSIVLLLTAAALTSWRAAGAEATPANNGSAAAKTATKTPAAALFPDSVVAKGKGVEVKRSQLDEEVIRIKAQYAAHGQTLPPEHTALMEQQLLEQLIQIQLIKAKATPADQDAGKALAEKRFAEAKKQLGDDEAVNQRLKSQGITREELLAKWSEAGMAETVVKRELKVSVTDDDVKKFYNENPGKFEKPEMVRAAHVLLSTKDMATNTELSDEKKAAKRKLAEDIVKRARAGEDFAKLAKDYSDDPGSKDKGGEYTFPRGQMVPEFEAAAFSLKTNQVSDVVTTQFGYHIIKLYEKIPAQKLELAKVSDQVKDMLVGQALQKSLPDYVAKLKKDAGVEILDEKLKPKEAPATAAPGLPPGHPAVQPAGKTDSK